ncbi:MAG: Glu/Leu/Phe/Val dehydrogenase dimerization domain-containing protein, partial [Thermoguttaceae bacterium]
MASSNAILATALYNFNQTARRLRLDENMIARLLEPQEKIEIAANPVLSNGQTFHFRAFIVRHNDALGPAKGGIRMSPEVSLDDVTGLAMEMTWKTSLIGVPFGGGKSGIRADPRRLGAVDKETVIRSFTRHVHRLIGPEIYIPAPDMGTNESDMGHIR